MLRSHLRILEKSAKATSYLAILDIGLYSARVNAGYRFDGFFPEIGAAQGLAEVLKQVDAISA